MRWLSLLLLPLALASTLWVYLQLSETSLDGLLVAGRPVKAGHQEEVRATLEADAVAWGEELLEVTIEGVSGRRRVRRAVLGAHLQPEQIMPQVFAAGRSGNPLHDLHTWFRARRGELNLRWPPTVDAQALARFAEAAQAKAELRPIAGITDGAGFTLPGRDGQALDLNLAILTLTQAIHRGIPRVQLTVERIPAPTPLKMASPDGALFAGVSENEPPPPTQAPVPREANDHCHSDPPQRPFCDGPRNVPVPYGPARELARSLGLGELSTVGELTRRGPKPEWVRAVATGAEREPLFFPVPAGKVGRGFGYVRKGELRDRIHPGVDIVAPLGAPIFAAGKAIVAFSDNNVRGYGNLLLLVHEDGAFTLYAHCQRISVFAGQLVQRGEQVGEVGMTGLAMGPHLHFEYHGQGGVAVDPMVQVAPVPKRL